MNLLGYLWHNIDWAASAAWVAAGAAIVALIADHSRFRLSQSVELLLKFEDKFDSTRLHKMRARAARAYKNGKVDEVDDVLDEIETIGLLAERKVLDYEMIWCSFGYWIIMYSHVWADYIKESQTTDPTVWTYFVKLAAKVKEIEIRTQGTLSNPDEDDVREFIRSEMTLK